MTTVPGWQVVASPDPDPGVATLPPAWFAGAGRATPYVKITRNSDPQDATGLPPDAPANPPALAETVLLAAEREGAAGIQAFVQPGTLGLAGAQVAWCSLTPMTAGDYRAWRLNQALTTGLGRWGLILAIIGFIFSGLLGVNSHETFLPAWLAAAFAATTPALQLVGAVLVFVQGAVAPR